MDSLKHVLVIGATGSIGQLVVLEAVARGLGVRALVRGQPRSGTFPIEVEQVIGDLTTPETLEAAVEGIDAVVFTHGSHGSKADAQQVDYGGVRSVLDALHGRGVRLALMTAIGVTNRLGSYNVATEAHDWKRRSERLVRASGMPYTIVRPGWFDYNHADQHRLVLLQGDRRQVGSPADGVISRRQIAQVLVASLLTPDAVGKTFELVAAKGFPQEEMGVLFSSLEGDMPGALDAVLDLVNMPLAEEPASVRDDLLRLSAR